MNGRTRRALAEINRVFYRDAASEFDAARQEPWQGWRRLADRIDDGQTPLRVFDVGCGNGRFARFLDDAVAGRRPIDYVGVDASGPLLERASTRRYSHLRARFEQMDFLNPESDERLADGPFDWITLFGVLHHLPGQCTRTTLLQQLARRLAREGVLAFTTWQFAAHERFRARCVSWDDYNRGAAEPIDLGELEDGDHLLPWGDGDPRVRYCHFAADEEVDALVRSLPLALVASFAADGRSGDLNRYHVLACA